MSFRNFIITDINYVKEIFILKNTKEDIIGDLLIYLHKHRYDTRNKININIKSYDW
nr:MAG TPA: hypothetical protein [Bacteriophage sp.]